jgi:hypothetical protein
MSGLAIKSNYGLKYKELAKPRNSQPPTRDGADLLLQVRCAVYNGTLGAGFGHRFDRIGNADLAFAKVT